MYEFVWKCTELYTDGMYGFFFINLVATKVSSHERYKSYPHSHSIPPRLVHFCKT